MTCPRSQSWHENGAPSLVPWLSTGYEGLQVGQAAGGWLQLLATECPRVLGKAGESVTGPADNLQEKQTLQGLEIPPRDLGTCNVTGPWMPRHISPCLQNKLFLTLMGPKTACSLFWKKPGGLTTGPRPLLTGNLNPIPGEASPGTPARWVHEIQQVVKWAPSCQEHGLQKPQLLPLTASALILLAQAFCTLVWILQCACRSSEEMVCFLLRRPVSYSHASRQVARWVELESHNSHHPAPQTITSRAQMSNYLFIGKSHLHPQVFDFLDGYLEGNPKTLSLLSNKQGVAVGPKRHKGSKNCIQKKLYVREYVGVDVWGNV